MIHVNRAKAAIAAVTIAGATAAAMLIPASPAVAFNSGGLVLDITVQPSAQLVAKGAAVAVGVDYTCSGTSFTNLSVSVTERVSGGYIANGNAFTSNTICDGTPQSVTLTVPAAVAGRAFKNGAADATGTLSGCAAICGTQTDNSTIAIR